jgi:uncharacterized protein (TIGR00730 family)
LASEGDDVKRICVFCGSSPGAKPEYTQAARQLGQALVARNLGLVYGGAGSGLMREVADAVLDAGGEVVGAIPQPLVEKEQAYHRLSDLRIVGSMHERKALMVDLSDGFIALPGGLGTFEELFEVLTWAQLGMHQKPCGLLNVSDYYTKLVDFIDHAVSQRFIKQVHRAMILVEEDAPALLDRFETYQAPSVDKWLDRESA